MEQQGKRLCIAIAIASLLLQLVIIGSSISSANSERENQTTHKGPVEHSETLSWLEAQQRRYNSPPQSVPSEKQQKTMLAAVKLLTFKL